MHFGNSTKTVSCVVIAFERALHLTGLMLALVDIHSVAFHAPKQNIDYSLPNLEPSPIPPSAPMCGLHLMSVRQAFAQDQTPHDELYQESCCIEQGAFEGHWSPLSVQREEFTGSLFSRTASLIGYWTVEASF